MELQHLNPNGIQHISAIVTLCEGYLCVPTVFDLWRYFFSVSTYRLKTSGTFSDVPAGCASMHLHSGGDHHERQFIEMGKLKTSN